MGDAENALPPSKKRAAGRELSRDNPGLDDEEDGSEQETGTFKRASDEVLAGRRMLKVRRNQTASAPSSNPFAGIRLVPPSEPNTAPAKPSATSTDVTAEAPTASEKPVPEDKENDASKAEKNEDENSKKPEGTIEEPVGESKSSENENNKESEGVTVEPVPEAVADKENVEGQKSDEVNYANKEADDVKLAEGDKSEKEDKEDNGKAEDEDKKGKSGEITESAPESASLSSFQQLSSSQNAFTGLAGTGFSTLTFSFGSIPPKEGSAVGTSSSSLFGNKQPSLGFGLSTNGNSSVFGTSGSSIVSKSEGSGFPSMQEVPVETGEENERVVFSADSVLFEFSDGGWKERGKGELKVNVSTIESEKARLLMRAKGNYRLILNASLYPDMKMTNMDKKGITFACVNSIGEGKEGLSTFALKFKDGSIVEEFRAAVLAHKGKSAAALKTPENSPKASEG